MPEVAHICGGVQLPSLPGWLPGGPHRCRHPRTGSLHGEQWEDLVEVAELGAMHLGGGRAGEGVRHGRERLVPERRDVSDAGGKEDRWLGDAGVQDQPHSPSQRCPHVMHQIGETEARCGEEQPAAGFGWRGQCLQS